MGYLLAVAWKRNALMYKQECEGKLHTITSKAKLAKKQAENMLNYLKYQAQVMNNNAQVQFNSQVQELTSQLYEQFAADYGLDPNDIQGGMQGLDEETRKQAQEQLARIQQQITNQTSTWTQELSNYKMQVEQWLEQQKELQYEPLKQEDELLAQEKEDAQDDLELAKQEYEAAQKLANEEIKNVVPQFGGQ